MTQNEYNKRIQAELTTLNRQIDIKILKGLSYAYESRKHKMLLSKLKRQKSTVFGRILHSFSFGQ